MTKEIKHPLPKFPEGESFMAEGLERLRAALVALTTIVERAEDLHQRIEKLHQEMRAAYAMAEYWQEIEGIDPSHARVFVEIVHPALLTDALMDKGRKYIKKFKRAVAAAEQKIGDEHNG